MHKIFDVAAYVLSKKGRMTAMKMQKLLYYCQAWSLVWDDHPLFDERFEAWANGPVSPTYFAEHRGEYTVAREPKGDPGAIKGASKETVDAVLKAYGDKCPEWLSDRTHREKPWILAREGLPHGERGSREIKQEWIHDYYGSL
jgi:uncharacterized phage-associated protein